MKLNKETALFLTKALFHYEQSCSISESVTRRVKDLRYELNEFVLGRLDSDEVENDKGSKVSWHVHGDDCNHADGEVLEKEDDVEDEEESEEVPETDGEVSAGELHELTACTSDRGQVEFEDINHDGGPAAVDVLIDGYTEYYSVTAVKRTAKALEVWTEGDWQTINVRKFPKDWTKLLPVNQSLLVCE